MNASIHCGNWAYAVLFLLGHPVLQIEVSLLFLQTVAKEPYVVTLMPTLIFFYTVLFVIALTGLCVAAVHKIIKASVLIFIFKFMDISRYKRFNSPPSNAISKAGIHFAYIS